MSTWLISSVRTLVPVVVGLVLSALAQLGFDVPEEVGTHFLVMLDVVMVSGYYGFVRWAEARWSWVGWFLGLPVPPEYEAAHKAWSARRGRPQ